MFLIQMLILEYSLTPKKVNIVRLKELFLFIVKV